MNPTDLPPTAPPRGDAAPSSDPPATTPLATPRSRAGMRGPPRSGERRTHALGWRGRDILRATAISTGYLLALALLWVAREIALTAFLGVLFGLAVGAATDRLSRYRIPRGLSAFVVVFGFVGLLYGVGAAIAPTLSAQGALLRERVPEAVDRIQSWVNERPGIAGLLLGGREVAKAGPTADDSAAATSGRPRASAAGAQSDTAGAQSVPTLRQRVTEQLSGVARYLFPFLSSTVTVVVGLFLILVLSIYIGAEPSLYHDGLMHLFPHESRERAGEVLTRIATVLRKWLVTQLIAMVVIGAVSTIALLLLDVKAALALGVIAGLLEFVPTIGPILSAVPAIAMAFLDSPEKALSVGIAYLIIQQVEGHLLIPMLMKEGMDLPPALTILAQAVMALVFGFLGLMVAVPVLAAVIVPIKMLYVQDVIGDMEEEEEDDST